MAYRTVTFKSVVDGVFALAGVTRTTAADPAALLAQVIDFVNLRLREAWEHHDWPELCPVEQRAFRDDWSAATDYAINSEVWFPGYQPIVVSGAGLAAANGTYYATGQLAGDRPIYHLNRDTSAARIELVLGQLILFEPSVGEAYGSAADNEPQDEVWGAIDAAEPAPNVTLAPDATADGAGYYRAILPASGHSPLDASRWVRISSFRRWIPYEQLGKTKIGEVLGMFARDPRRSPRACGRLSYTLSAEGVVPVSTDCDLVWLRFRSRPPTYSVANYENATPANFPVPYVLDTFIRRAACADFLRMEAKFDEAGRLESKAYQDLANAADAAGASQAQFPTARVHTY